MKIDKHKHRKGQALVEAAFVLFIVVLFTFAITEFGRAMYIKNMLNNAARAGARQAVVTGSLPLSRTYNFSAVPSDQVGLKIYNGLMYVPKSLVTASVACTGATGCSGMYAGTGATITVTVSSPFSPFVNLFQITSTLVGQASMRYE